MTCGGGRYFYAALTTLDRTMTARIIGTFESLIEAQAAANRLTSSGVDWKRLSIIGDPGRASRRWSQMKKSLAWGSALGTGLAFLLLPGGIFYLAGHLSRSGALQVLGVTAKGMLIGAAAGGMVDLFRSARVDRRAGREAADTLAAGRFALALTGDWVMFQHARAAIANQQAQADEYLVEMVCRYGYEHQSFVLLYGGMEVWQSTRPEAAVVYRRVGRVAIVGAAPLTKRENLQEVIGQFLGFCRQQNLDCLMLPLGSQTAEVAHKCGMGLLKIGESGYFKLPDWKPAGDRAKKVRAGVNQARKAGVVVERYDPRSNQDRHARAEIEELCQQWIDTREVDLLGWLLELDPLKLAEHKRYFLARASDGHLEGMLACSPIPARNGWYLEDLIRRPGAGRGVSELLVVEALRALASEGAELATLATPPSAGIEPSGEFKQLARLLKLIYEHLDVFYHFKALHRFKAKFAPSFIDAEFAAIYPPRIRLRMALGV